ncbi:hypothetical protein V6N11_003732 [Hibiscus sabdariffa]|uniref:Uncharacterized protein n=1 Tax=Hibiscus sabdariffa TaxID=183260 RepID=A0ABR2SEU0_9ROSI
MDYGDVGERWTRRPEPSPFPCFTGMGVKLYVHAMPSPHIVLKNSKLWGDHVCKDGNKKQAHPVSDRLDTTALAAFEVSKGLDSRRSGEILQVGVRELEMYVENVCKYATRQGDQKNAINVDLTTSNVAVEEFCVSQYGTHGSALGSASGLIKVRLDGMVTNLASLFARTVTNPFGNGYFQGPVEAPLEIFSACPGIYGKGAYPNYAETCLWTQQLVLATMLMITMKENVCFLLCMILQHHLAQLWSNHFTASIS